MELPLLDSALVIPLAAAALGAAVTSVAVAKWRRGALRASARAAALAAAPRARHDEELRAIGAAVVALAGRLDRLSEILATDSRHGAQAAARGAGADAGYELAVRLARSGARPDELVRACAIRPEEAALLLRLHGGGRAAQGAPAAHAGTSGAGLHAA
jgi:hypothetical protein